MDYVDFSKDRKLDKIQEFGFKAVGYVLAFGAGFVFCMLAFGV